MKTKDVESKTGISKQTIMYYEKENLIAPKRDENGYRNYNEQDLQILMLIKLLRSMNVSIDDIRLVLEEKLSFQECLKTQSSFLEETINNLEDIKSDISFYKEKNLPLIPALNDLDKIDTQSFIRFKKKTPSVTIGQKLTKNYLKKKIFMTILISIFIGLVSYFGMKKTLNNGYILISIIISLAVFLISIIAYGFGLGELGPFSTQNNAVLFIEFDEYGINYARVKKFSDRILYAFNTLKSKDSLIHRKYEDIQNVDVNHVKRYMKIPGSNLSDYINTIDYYFTFNDGEKYTLINPILLDNDREIIHIILNEKTTLNKKD